MKYCVVARLACFCSPCNYTGVASSGGSDPLTDATKMLNILSQSGDRWLCYYFRLMLNAIRVDSRKQVSALIIIRTFLLMLAANGSWLCCSPRGRSVSTLWNWKCAARKTQITMGLIGNCSNRVVGLFPWFLDAMAKSSSSSGVTKTETWFRCDENENTIMNIKVNRNFTLFTSLSTNRKNLIARTSFTVFTLFYLTWDWETCDCVTVCDNDWLLYNWMITLSRHGQWKYLFGWRKVWLALLGPVDFVEFHKHFTVFLLAHFLMDSEYHEPC